MIMAIKMNIQTKNRHTHKENKPEENQIVNSGYARV